MEKTPDYTEGSTRDPRNPPNAAEEDGEKKARTRELPGKGTE